MKESNKADAVMVKLMNRELIINELRRHPKQSRADLAKKTRLSKPAVSEIVKELIEEGIVFESGVGPSRGGKKPILLEYNARSNYVVGCFIENEMIFVALGDMNGEIVNMVKKEFTSPAEGQWIIDRISEGVKSLLKAEKVDPRRVLGMAVGVSGIAGETENSITTSPTIHWNDIDLKRELSGRLHLDVVIENDVNLMTIGEFHKGQGKNINHFIYLFIGNGIGSGLFLNGQCYRGFHSAAGEIGFMMIGDENNKNSNLGVFEANFGRMGISERLKALHIPIERGDSILKAIQEHKKEEKVNQLLDEVLEHWAKAAINMISILDPQAVILAGELAYLDPSSFERFKGMIEKYVPKMPEMKITRLGAMAGVYGAFHLALDHFHITGFKTKS
ncbi:ROK family transcriptional regulator [Caldibacillus debilis]|uniref:ROK family transcriptional regulator n=1 Tax=Caldibacillus debilis TaxID=301148 RepID=UPI000E3A096B|nr:ROK family transcriptional regulator [Caldibacillus debilis]REJ27325.1 MAG: ROK family transcriptional regulator [Caldibacillus debilis]